MGTRWPVGGIAWPRRADGRPRRCRAKRWRCSIPALDLIVDGVPSPDAYTQERALLPAVLAWVQAGELWIADRNFCTRGGLWDLQQRGAVGLVREHAQIPFAPLEGLRVVGGIESGRVSDQRVVIDAPDGSGTLEVRRIRLELREPGYDNNSFILRPQGRISDARS